METWADLVLIQCVWAAGCGADSAVGSVDGNDGGAAAFNVNIVGGIG